MTPFVAPPPEPLERIENYIQRLARAFEIWVNTQEICACHKQVEDGEK